MLVARRQTISLGRLFSSSLKITTLANSHGPHDPAHMSPQRHPNRPLSPHLTIYQPQLTWLMSIGHRVTGAALSTGLYAFGAWYAMVQPGAITEAMSSGLYEMLPLWLIGTGKFALSSTFFYHTYNGIRHLVWDAGRALTLKAVYAGGWAVNIASLFSALLTTLLF